jgi:hypothetical protein
MHRVVRCGARERPQSAERRHPLTADDKHGGGWNRMETRRSPTEARQGRKPGIVRFMLLVSLAATAVIFSIVYFYFAAPSSQ